MTWTSIRQKILLAFIGLFATLSFASAPAEAGRIQRWARKLNLTEAQQKQIKSIVYAARRTQIPLRAQLQLARLDMQQLLDQHKPDEQKVIEAIEKVGKLELELKKSRILMMVRIKAILTPAQAAKATALNRVRRNKRQRRWRRWMKRRWGRDGAGGHGGPGGPGGPDGSGGDKPKPSDP